MLKKLSQTRKAFLQIPRFRNSVLIKGGTVVNADRQFKADVKIENGKVSQLFLPEHKIQTQQNFSKVYDATGKYVMPGGIDPHVHLELPFMGQIKY